MRTGHSYRSVPIKDWFTMDFTDQIAVLTGAGGGIGRAVALGFGRREAHVFVSDLSALAAETVAAEIAAAGGTATPARCDVSVDSDVVDLARTVEGSGPVDVLFNNAGVAVGGPVGAVALHDWRWVFEVNVLGAVRMLNAFLPVMAHRGSAIVVNMSSSLALWPEVPLVLPYISILAISEAFAPVCAAQGVRVVALGPDVTATSFHVNARLSGVQTEEALRCVPVVEMQFPEAISDALFAALDGGHFLATNVPGLRLCFWIRWPAATNRRCAYPTMTESITKYAHLLTGASVVGAAINVTGEGA